MYPTRLVISTYIGDLHELLTGTLSYLLHNDDLFARVLKQGSVATCTYTSMTRLSEGILRYLKPSDSSQDTVSIHG